MKSEQIKSYLKEWDGLVVDKFKEIFVNFIRLYSDNPTKAKLKTLLLNMPVGAFLKPEDFDKIIKEKLPGFSELLDLLIDKNTITTLFKEHKHEQ